MKRTLLTTLALILPLSLAQKGSDGIDFISHRSNSLTGTDAWVAFGPEIPAKFPEKSKTLSVEVSCKGIKPSDDAAFADWLKQTGGQVKGNSLTIKGVTLSCDNNRFSLQAPTLEDGLRLFMAAGYPNRNDFGSDKSTSDPRLAFYERRTCRYPALELECHTEFLYLSFLNNTLTPTGYQFYPPSSTVGARQGGEIVGVQHQYKSTPFSFDPNQPLEVFVQVYQTTVWQHFVVEKAKGKLTWWTDLTLPQ